jgi:hypothetical protein
MGGMVNLVIKGTPQQPVRINYNTIMNLDHPHRYRSQPPLPSGWEKINMVSHSGIREIPYYSNPGTNMRSFNHPLLPVGWYQDLINETGETVYLDHVNGTIQITWPKPRLLPRPSAQSAGMSKYYNLSKSRKKKTKRIKTKRKKKTNRKKTKRKKTKLSRQ